MPPEPLRRRHHPVTFERRIQLLTYGVRVGLDCPDLDRWLDAHLPLRAAQACEIATWRRFAVARAANGYHILEDGQEVDIEPSVSDAGANLYRRIHEHALQTGADFTHVHGGSGDFQGVRFIVVGERGSGKTTLMLRLLVDGFAVHGDELLFTDGGHAVAFPRRFRMKRGVLALVPGLAAVAPALTVAETGAEAALLIDPADVNAPWDVRPSAVDAVFYLEPNHGGRSRVRPCRKHVMASWLMRQSRAPCHGIRRWIEDVSALVENAHCYTLQNGNLDEAVADIRDQLLNVSRDRVSRWRTVGDRDEPDDRRATT